MIRQGDHGDRFYVIAEGQVGWSATASRCGPRARASSSARSRCCATSRGRRPCTRLEPGLLYALERDTFVYGVTNNPRCVLAADDVIDERLANVALEPR